MTEPTSPNPPRVITTSSELHAVAAELAGATRIAFDLESNGLFVYRASTCIVQLSQGANVVVVDAIATPVTPLADLLGVNGPIKVVHDVSFDARMLAENGIALGNVHDTSIAARMLGRTATGLASLMASELGITLDKALQHHDWSARPLEAKHLTYLARDVAHLEELEEKLWAQARERGIEEEILEETRYRLRGAIAALSAPDPEPGYMRVKGLDRLGPVERAIVRHLWEARDREASSMNVPPYKVIGNEAFVDIAKARPADRAALSRIRGAAHGRAASMAGALLRAVAAGIADGDLPAEDKKWLERPRVAAVVAKARRARESRVMAWRKREAAARGVDEQVVLPGHCVKEIAEPETMHADEIANVGGFGACRSGYAEAIMLALRAPDAAEDVEDDADG